MVVGIVMEMGSVEMDMSVDSGYGWEVGGGRRGGEVMV